MHRLLRIALVSAAACAPAAAVAPVTVSPPPASPPRAVVTATAPPPSRCPHPKLDAPVALATSATPNCTLLREGLVASVERTMRQRFKPSWGTHRLVVDFGCDDIDPFVRTIDFEDGSGHGGSLRIFRLTALPGPSPRYDVRAIGYSGYYNVGLAYARGEIDGAKLAASLDATRVAMIVRLHDVELLPDGNKGLGGSFSFSSNDFHLQVRLTDANGRSLERGFTGYDSSLDQDKRLPAQLAAEPIQAAIATVVFAAGAPTDADRELFESHFARAFAGDVGWWVGERFLEMVPTLGSSALVTPIVRWLERSDPKGMDRIRAKAVAALAAITGLDLRKDAAGNDRPIEDVVADYVRECG